MVGQLHDRSRRHVLTQRAGRIGQYQPLDAEAMQRFERRAHDRGIALFIVVRAAGQHDDRCSAQVTGDDLSRMAGNAAVREALKIRIGDLYRIIHLRCQGTEAGAQHDRRFGHQPVQLVHQN